MATKTETLSRTNKTNKTNKTIKAYPGIFKKTDDIVVPDILFHPTVTGTPEIDKAYSEMGGITPSCVTLVTGTPGAGKTTLMAVVGARLQTPKPVVFLSYEMSDFQLKLTAKKIEGLNDMLIVTEEFHKDKEKFEHFLFTILADLDPALVIVDSLQKMAGVMPGSYNANQIYITEQLTKFAKQTFVPVNMIGHVSKDGTYKGPTTIKHEVDAHMHIWEDKELGERVFGFSKNRFGGVGDPYVFRITNHGVFIGEEWWLKAATNMPQMAKDSIAEFRSASESQKTVPFKPFQKMAKDVMKWLESEHKGELENDTAFGNSSIKLAWMGKKAWCNMSTGKINFGKKFFKTITNKNFGRIGYAKEKAFINRCCENKEDIALWVILHEFQHLFTGNDKHVKAFFSKIEQRFQLHQTILKA